MSKRLLELAGVVKEGSHMELDTHNLRVAFAHFALSWALERSGGNQLQAREMLRDIHLEDILPRDVLQSGLDLAAQIDDHDPIRRDQSFVKFEPSHTPDHPKSSYRVK